MENEIIHIDYKMTMVFSFFYIFFFATIGFIVYMLMRKPSARRELFSELPAASGLSSLVAALLIAVPGIAYVYINSWSNFYSISKNDASLTLKYIYPERTENVDISNTLQIGKSMHVSRGGVMYRIKIIDSRGKVYRSILTNKRFADESIEKIRDIIIKQKI
jgi:hypothetical protein